MSLNDLHQSILSRADQLAESAIHYLSEYRKSSGIDRAVVGLSGGADSTLVAYIAKSAGYKLTGLLMPSQVTPEDDIRDAEKVAESYCASHHSIPIDEIATSFIIKLTPHLKDINRLTKGNLFARIRMALLYSFANQLDAIVLGTGDKSEYFLGYFTKYGDAACDLFPVLHMYKTQVRHLVKKLGYSQIAEKKPSPRLWKDHTAEGELGLDYHKIDLILETFISGNREYLQLFSPVEIKTVISRYLASRHKRQYLSLFDVGELISFESSLRRYSEVNGDAFVSL